MTVEDMRAKAILRLLMFSLQMGLTCSLDGLPLYAKLRRQGLATREGDSIGLPDFGTQTLSSADVAYVRLYIEVALALRALRGLSVEHWSIAHAIDGQTRVGGGWR